MFNSWTLRLSDVHLVQIFTGAATEEIKYLWLFNLNSEYSNKEKTNVSVNLS